MRKRLYLLVAAPIFIVIFTQIYRQQDRKNFSNFMWSVKLSIIITFALRSSVLPLSSNSEIINKTVSVNDSKTIEKVVKRNRLESLEKKVVLVKSDGIIPSAEAFVPIRPILGHHSKKSSMDRVGIGEFGKNGRLASGSGSGKKGGNDWNTPPGTGPINSKPIASSGTTTPIDIVGDSTHRVGKKRSASIKKKKNPDFYEKRRQKKLRHAFGLKDIGFPDRQLEKKFKHSSSFDSELKGANCNRGTRKKYLAAIKKHMSAKGTRRICGTYRGQEAVHYFNPDTKLNVIVNPLTRDYVSGWELGADQIFHLRKNNNIN